MTTRTPTQQRSVRESRIEKAHVEGVSLEKPPIHFKVTGPFQPHQPGRDSQAAMLPKSRLLSHAAQVVKTTLPFIFADAAGLALSLTLAAVSCSLIFHGLSGPIGLTPQLFADGLAFLLIYSLLGLYPGVGLNPIIELRSLVWGTLTAGAALLLMSFSLGHGSAEHATLIVLFTGICLLVAPLARCICRSVMSNISWWGQPAVLIGNPESCRKLMKVLSSKRAFGIRPVGIVLTHGDSLSGDNSTPEAESDLLGELPDLPAICQDYKVFWALIAPDSQRQNSCAHILNYCDSIPNVVMIPGIEEFPSLWNRTQDLGGVLGICFRERLLDPWSQVGKRLFDITAVLLGTLVLSPLLIPLLIVTWVCMKLNSPGPIFYGQERVGKDGVRFQAWKFRTMVLNAESALKVYLQKHPEKKKEWDVNQKLRQDPRIIPGIGNFLRKTSLDELPQLWNVLCGDMSLVGPRPFMTEQTEIYGDRFTLYQKVRPGITGLWQISGRNHTTFEERGRYDAYYVRNWSFWLDIFILGRTVKTVLFREGAF